MQRWHAKKYANKVGMMHESKVNVLTKPIPTSFSHYSQTVHGSLLKHTTSLPTLITGSSCPYPEDETKTMPCTAWMGAVSVLKDAVQLQCDKDVGMGLCQYIDLCFYASSLPCLHTYWHTIPIAFYIFCSCFYTSFLVLISAKARSTSKSVLSSVWQMLIL